MHFRLKTIAILGLGLIGGSLGLALKKASSKYRVVGYSRRSASGYLAIKKGAIDVFEGEFNLAIKNADIVILATPIMAMKEIFGQIAGSLKKGCLVSDVGSTKAQVMSWAKKLLPGDVQFIGGHPMAGKEKSGIEYAEAELFKGCIYCLIPESNVSQANLSSMQEIVKELGARPLIMEPEEHDRFVAAISHVPFLISSALFSSILGSREWERIKGLAASGFRDTTRLASGDPAMYRDICLTNSDNIKLWLRAFSRSLKKLERDMGEEKDEIERSFYRIKKARDAWLSERPELDGSHAKGN